MLREKEIRLILIILLFLTILFYEGLGYLNIAINNKFGYDFLSYNSLKIGRFLISVMIAMLTTRLTWIFPLFNIPIIKGYYQGVNKEKLQDETEGKIFIEEFEIEQTLIKTSISGRTIIEKNDRLDFHALYTGQLIERDFNKFIFSIEVITTGKKLFGLLILTAQNNSLSGFFDYSDPSKFFRERMLAFRIAKEDSLIEKNINQDIIDKFSSLKKKSIKLEETSSP